MFQQDKVGETDIVARKDAEKEHPRLYFSMQNLTILEQMQKIYQLDQPEGEL